MKRIILLILLNVSLMATAQTITKTKTLKSTDLGNQKLEAVVGRDTVYVMLITTGSRAMKYLTVELGNKENALRILSYLLDADIKKGDFINLENPTDNIVTKNALGGYLVYSQGRQFSGQLRKPNIKGFIEAIQEFSE